MHGRGLRAELICTADARHGFFNIDPYYEGVYQQIESVVLDVLHTKDMRS